MQTWHQIDDQSNCLVGTSKLWQRTTGLDYTKHYLGPGLSYCMSPERDSFDVDSVCPECEITNKINSD